MTSSSREEESATVSPLRRTPPTAPHPPLPGSREGASRHAPTNGPPPCAKLRWWCCESFDSRRHRLNRSDCRSRQWSRSSRRRHRRRCWSVANSAFACWCGCCCCDSLCRSPCCCYASCCCCSPCCLCCDSCWTTTPVAFERALLWWGGRPPLGPRAPHEGWSSQTATLRRYGRSPANVRRSAEWRN